MFDPIYHDIAIAPLWGAANVLLMLATWRLARRLFTGDHEDQLVVHSIIAGWACVTGTAMVLGSVEALTGVALTATVGTGAGLFLYRDRRRPEISSPVDVDSDRIGLVYRILTHLFFGFLFTFSIINGLGRFPNDWDTLMYHLSRIDQWIQANSLLVSDSYNWSHPGNNELIGLWMVAPFSGDFLISLNNIPAVSLLGFASISLGRSLGLSRGVSYLTAAAIIGNAVVFRQLLDAKNDIAIAGLFIACLYYGLRAARSDRFPELLWGGIAIGLLAGVKYNGLGYAALALASVALIVAVGRGLRAMVIMSAVWSCCMIPLGGFWYVRNAIMVGEPLYPMGLTQESNLLAVIYPSLNRSSFWGCGRLEVIPLAIDAVWRLAGPAQLVAVLAAPVAVIWLTSSAFFMRYLKCFAIDILCRRVLALWMVGSGAILLVTPFSVEDVPDTLNHLRDGYTPVRFGLCFLSVSLLALSIMIQDLSRVIWCLIVSLEMRLGHRVPVSAANGALIQSSLLAALPLVLWGATILSQLVNLLRRSVDDLSFHLFVSMVLVEAAWLLWLTRKLNIRFRRWLDPALILVLTFGLAGTCGRLSSNWHRNYARHYDAIFGTEVFSRLSTTRPRPTHVCVLFYRAYPFHGSTRQVRVLQPMWVPSYQWLIDYTITNHVDILIISRTHPLYTGWTNYDSITQAGVKGDRRWQTVYEDGSFEVLESSPNPSGVSSK